MPKAKITALGVFVLFLVALPFWVGPYTVQVAITTITYAMLGLAFAFTMKAGLPRMDIPVWWGIGGYTTALLMKAGWNFWLTALIGGLISVIVGWLVFSFAIRRGMMAFFMICMVLTMAFYQVWASVPIFGGWSGIVNVPAPTIGSFAFLTKPALYYLGLFFLVLTVAVYYLLYNSKIGRAWSAIGSAPRLARSVGVDVVNYRIANVLIGNFFIALVGSYFVGYYHGALPTVFSFSAGLMVMVYLIIGGMMHSLAGPILGAIIATFIPEYLHVEAQYQSIAMAVIVILILLFLPGGILGGIDQYIKPRLYRQRWYARLTKRGKNEEVRRQLSMALLELKSVGKNFGKLQAVSNLDFSIDKGEIRSLIGPNGAGKTTVFNIITGTFPATNGRVIFNGQDITKLAPHQIAQLGIVRSFQQAFLFMWSTVLDNVLIGFHMNCRAGALKEFLHTASARKTDREAREKALEIIKFMGLGGLEHFPAGSLPHGHQRALGVSIALACNPTLLLLDEPVTGMNPTETADMVERIRKIRDKGITIILVEHAMKVVMDVSDRITVLNYGQKIAEGLPDEIKENREVIEAYLGREEKQDAA